MANPFDYIGPLADIPSVSDSFTKGIMTAESLSAIQRKNEAERMAIEQQVQMQNDLGQLYQNPTISGINRVMARYPAMADKFKPLLDSMNEQQKAARIQQANNVFMPLLHGDRATAIEQLKLNETAAKNTGDEAAAQSLGMMRKLVESTETGKAGDNMVLASVGSFLSAAMGEKEFAKTYETILAQKRASDLAPALQSTAEAEAKIKANEAKGVMPPKFVETETGIMQWDTAEGRLVPTGFKPKRQTGVNISLGTPQFAVEEATGKQVLYQPSASGEVKIIRGLSPVTEQTKESAKEAAKFDKLAGAISIARKTLKDATGSIAGAALASGQRVFGVSSSATKANSKLKAIQGAMIMNLPRMEGPQSDSDRLLYIEQAGKIGDPTVPIEDRLAALDVLDELTARYKSGPTPPAAKEPTKGATSVDELMSLLNKK